jgi:hypothetical protein
MTHLSVIELEQHPTTVMNAACSSSSPSFIRQIRVIRVRYLIRLIHKIRVQK